MCLFVLVVFGIACVCASVLCLLCVAIDVHWVVCLCCLFLCLFHVLNVVVVVVF